MTDNSKQSCDVSSNQMSPARAGLVLRLQEWSRNCLIDGLKMDKGEPTLQALLREAYLTLMRSPDETPLAVSKDETVELLRNEIAAVGQHGLESLHLDVLEKAITEIKRLTNANEFQKKLLAAYPEEIERLRPLAESWESYEAAQERKAEMRSDETSGDAIYENMGQLVADAARYRYLRGHLGSGFAVKQAHGDPLGFAGPTLLDSALDAALAPCPGCEGWPKDGNNPCTVCGLDTRPITAVDSCGCTGCRSTPCICSQLEPSPECAECEGSGESSITHDDGTQSSTADPPCEKCGGSGRLTIYDTATYPGQPCSPIGDEPCPTCRPEKASCLHVAGPYCVCVKCGKTVNFGVMPSLNGTRDV